MPKDEVAEQVETACTKVSSYLVWLPEHLEKANMSFDEAKSVVDRANAEFHSTLESLDPPAELKGPVERLAAERELSPDGPAELKAQLRKEQGLYEQVGADRCGKTIQATIETLDGTSFTDAYHDVGLSLPPRPDGW